MYQTKMKSYGIIAVIYYWSIAVLVYAHSIPDVCS